MKLHTPTNSPQHLRRGLTLVELSVMIAVILALVGVLFGGAQAWKRGSDRANCIIQIRNVQNSIRSFSNMNGIEPGADTTVLNPPVVLQTELIGDGKFLERIPSCPAKGSYSYAGNTIPEIGSLYMTCSLDESNGHTPDIYADW